MEGNFNMKDDLNSFYSDFIEQSGVAEKTQEEAQNDLLTDMDNENQRIRDLMAERRAKLKAQNAAIEIQSKLCNGMKELKELAIEEQIKEFATTNFRLYDYIRKLEHINKGIWCPKCDKIKSIGVPPAADTQNTQQNTQQNNQQTQNETQSATPNITQFTEQWDDLHNTMQILKTEQQRLHESYIKPLLSQYKKLSAQITAVDKKISDGPSIITENSFTQVPSAFDLLN